MKARPPAHYISRELSWLEFNQRVLNEAINPLNPLLERVKFFSIVSSNLDEFFEVRVAGLKQQMESGHSERSADGRSPSETFKAIHERVLQMVARQSQHWREEILPLLDQQGIRFLKPAELQGNARRWLDDYYHQQVRPVLTPLGIDPAHPFPQLLNKSLNVILQLEVNREAPPHQHLAVVQVPQVLPRLVQLPSEAGRREYVFLGHLIGHYLEDLFPGTRVLGYWHFRVTRNSELYIDEDDARNLLSAVEQELHNRRKGAAVRLEVDHHTPREIYEYLLETLDLTEADLYRVEGPLNPNRLMALCAGDHSPELRDRPFFAPVGNSVRDCQDLFAAIRQQDILLHHPYENFSTVVEFLEQAAADPNVLAIKQTLYRTGGDPRIVGALMNAARSGKQVTAVTELKARFDEANNILWARRLEEAGVHVVYGMVRYKVHSKMALVVRRDEDRIRRYLHLGTGNYNPSTAKLYTDLSLFTARPEFGEDATNLFNLLTGIGRFQGAQKLLIAPFTLHQRLLELVGREIRNASAKKPARIVAKMNGLVDRSVIDALYEASCAGVQIDLIVRGICCLRPGLPGVSENIRVRSLIGRFLEHSRVYYFENAGDPEVFVGSADWMPRNLYNRVEVVFPIDDPSIKSRLVNEILDRQLADNTKAWQLGTEGTYQLLQPTEGSPARNAQAEFMQLALDSLKKRPARLAEKPQPVAARKRTEAKNKKGTRAIPASTKRKPSRPTPRPSTSPKRVSSQKGVGRGRSMSGKA
jgi:polyphosphate kinase